jgi:hypothetical protein
MSVVGFQPSPFAAVSRFGVVTTIEAFAVWPAENSRWLELATSKEHSNDEFRNIMGKLLKWYQFRNKLQKWYQFRNKLQKWYQSYATFNVARYWYYFCNYLFAYWFPVQNYRQSTIVEEY